MAAAITLKRVQELVDQLPAHDQLKLIAHISERLSAVMPTVSQAEDGAGATQQQRLQTARDLLSGVAAVVHVAQGEFDAADALKMLRGARTQPTPDAWLTTVG